MRGVGYGTGSPFRASQSNLSRPSFASPLGGGAAGPTRRPGPPVGSGAALLGDRRLDAAQRLLRSASIGEDADTPKAQRPLWVSGNFPVAGESPAVDREPESRLEGADADVCSARMRSWRESDKAPVRPCP